MKNILISNIGNRNLKVNGKFITKIFDSENNLSFREQTSIIWQKIQKNENKDELEPVIISEVIEKEKNELIKVILFSSDMPETLRNDQDTVFEGEILCHILKQKYPGIEFVNIPVRASVFIHDELFRQYRRILSELKSKHKEKHVVYCDAGGTSQQKFSIKIALEYLFDPDQFTVYYVAQEQKGISKIMRGESYEYRKIIEMEHISRAIQSSSYQIATELLSRHITKNLSHKVQLISFLDNRLRLFFHSAENDAKQLLQTNKINIPSFVQQYLNNEPVGDYAGWENVLDKSDFFQLCEILIASQWKFLNNHIEQAVHFFVMFYENYLLMVIQKHFGYNVRKNYDYYMDRLIMDIQGGIFELPEGILPVKGIPLQIVFTEQLKEVNHLKLLKLLKKLNSILSGTRQGIDKIRNDYAHRGKAITKKNFEKKPFYSHFMECFRLMGINFDRNYYDEMHREVCEIIRN